jgi:hypothetical protein
MRLLFLCLLLQLGCWGGRPSTCLGTTGWGCGPASLQRPSKRWVEVAPRARQLQSPGAPVLPRKDCQRHARLML